MKKARSSSAPTPKAVSLRAMPEIDFTRYEIRRNRFAARVKREGIELVHEEPSPASLAEIPEVELSAPARRRRSVKPATATVVVQVGKGRPRRGSEVGPTSVRSVRLPADMWRSLEHSALRSSMTLHGVLRTAIVRYLERATAPAPRPRTPKRAAR